MLKRAPFLQSPPSNGDAVQRLNHGVILSLYHTERFHMLACAAPLHASEVLGFLLSIPAWVLMSQAIEWVKARV